jgi:hypothetical protein
MMEMLRTVNNSEPMRHQGGMSVRGQLAALRAKEQRNVAGAIAIQLLCACVVVAALGGSRVVGTLAVVAIAVSIAVRWQRLPSPDAIAERIDRSEASFGLVRTALASEAGRADGSPALVADAVAHAKVLVAARGPAIVRPFRLPRGAVVAALLASFVSIPRVVAPPGTGTVPDDGSVFSPTGIHFDRLVALLQAEDGAGVARRPASGAAGGERSRVEGGGATTDLEVAAPEEADLTGTFDVPSTPEADRTPGGSNPCPPGLPCAPAGVGDVGPAGAGGGGSNGRAPDGADLPGGSMAAETDASDVSPDGARNAPEAEGMADANGPGATEGKAAGRLQQRDDAAPGDRLTPNRDGIANSQTGGIHGSGGTDDSIAERSELDDAKLAEEQIEGLWQASAEGTVDAIEDGLAGERTTVPWRDLHAWYEAIAEDAVAKVSVPVSRRAYVRRYFDALAPREPTP